MDQSYDIVMIGHVSKDINIYQDNEEHHLGGPVVYSSAAAVRSGASVLVVTKAASEDRDKLAILYENEADVVIVDSSTTTSIQNIYHTADRERRTVTLLSSAEPFRAEDVPDVDAGVYHLAGLFVGEIPAPLIEALSRRGEVGIDAQGVLRTNENGSLVFRDWPEKQRYLPAVTYLKTDAAEAEILTGEPARERAAHMLLDMGPKEVMVTHHSEVIVVDREGIHRAPITSRRLDGRTGRGDTCFAAYLARRREHDVDESTAYAAALVSIKMESPGVFRGTREDVFERMKTDAK